MTEVLRAITMIVQNHGWSVIIFTILIRLVLMPLDYKSRKGMKKMSAMQPKLNALQKKYGNDKQKMQQKQAELFKKEHYNPLSGCLPMLIQWPIFFIMFAAMRAIANEQMVSQVFKYLEGIVNPIAPSDTWLWVKNIWAADSPFTSVAPTLMDISAIPRDIWQKMFDQLTPDQLALIAQNIPNYAEGIIDFSEANYKATVTMLTDALQTMPAYEATLATVPGWSNLNFLIINISLFQNYNGLLILPILAGVTQVLSLKINPQQTGVDQPAQNGKQGAGMNNFMKYFFPILSVYFCLISNAGFAVYWVTSNVVSGVQSVLINKYIEKKEQQAAANVSGEGSVK